VDGLWEVFLNEDDMPQLRLSPTYRRLLARDAADREVRKLRERALHRCDSTTEEYREQRKHTNFAGLPVHHRAAGRISGSMARTR